MQAYMNNNRGAYDKTMDSKAENFDCGAEKTI